MLCPATEPMLQYVRVSVCLSVFHDLQARFRHTVSIKLPYADEHIVSLMGDTSLIVQICVNNAVLGFDTNLR